MMFLSPIYLYVDLSVHIYVTYKPFINPLCSLHSTWKSRFFKYMNVILHGCKLERKPRFHSESSVYRGFIGILRLAHLFEWIWIGSPQKGTTSPGAPERWLESQKSLKVWKHLPFQLQKSATSFWCHVFFASTYMYTKNHTLLHINLGTCSSMDFPWSRYLLLT